MTKICPKCGKEWEGYHNESATNHFCTIEDRIRMIITSACSSVWKDTINDLSAKGSIQRSIDYALREIMNVIEEIQQVRHMVEMIVLGVRMIVNTPAKNTRKKLDGIILTG
ncbi:MAG TPA: hypothetical protein PLN39_02530 [Candidatus Dojkabacteria bacterium]|nr:hypothetical protein [Candidatus Dojkabacteria bacterium]